MKKNSFNLFLPCIFCTMFFFHCSDWTNPYLDPSSAKVLLKPLSFKNGDTVSIFSRDSFAIEVYLREHLTHFSLNIKGNRYWTDKTIDASSFDKNQLRFSFSFNDTGNHEIILTTCHSNGDSSSEKIQLYATSPLKQNTLEINAGDTVTLSTNAVKENVNIFYVWDLHDGIKIKEYKPTVEHTFVTVPASIVGELYVIDQNDYRSPSSFFLIKPKTSVPTVVKITSENQLVSGDTIFSSTPTIQFIGKVSGITGVKSFKINDTICDTSITKSDGSYLFYDLFQNIDSLSPFRIVIQITNNSNKIFTTTMVIKYLEPGTFDQPVISVITPSQDSSISNTQTIPIYGQITNSSRFQSGTIFTYIGSNLQSGYTRVTGGAFIADVKLDVGWNSILFNFFPDTTGQGNSLSSREIFVKFDPLAKDIVPPKIIFVANGDTKLEDSLIVRTPSVSLNIWVMDNSPIKSVFVNEIPAHTNDSLPFTALLNLKHLDNKIVIKATDNSDLTSTYTFNSIKYNRLPIMAVEFSQKQFIADSVIKWKVSVSDPDNDTLSVTAFVNDTIIPMSSDGIILWRPSIKDTGWDTIKIEAYDKCEKVDTSFIINVSKLQNANVAVKWLTNGSDIDDTLVVGEDTLRCALKKNPFSNLQPFNFKVELLNPSKIIHDSSDSSLLWIPVINDTGNREIKFTITDANNNIDIFTDYIKIEPVLTGIRFEKATITDQESSTNTQINVLLSKPLTTTVTVNYDIDWTHTTASGSDFSPITAGTITFNPGEITKSINVHLTNDSDAESDEQIAFRLSKPSSNAYLETQSSMVFTILDDDYVTCSFSTSQGNGNESVRDCSVNVTLSAPCKSMVTLSCTVDSLLSTATSSDYTFSWNNQTITFLPGQTTATVRFQINSDFLNETDEILAFRLKPISNNVRPGNVILYKYTIDGPKETIKINLDNVKFTEMEYQHDINIHLRSSDLISSPVSVYFSIDHAASTADSGTDFIILQSSPIIFQPNEWSKNIVVRIFDDLIKEPDEKIIINLIKTSTGATLASGAVQTVITISKNN